MLDEQAEMLVILRYMEDYRMKKKKEETAFEMTRRFIKENQDRHKRVRLPGDDSYLWDKTPQKYSIRQSEHEAKDFKALGYSSNKEKIIMVGWWNFKTTQEEMNIIALETIEERKEYSIAPINKTWLKKELIKFCEFNCGEFDKTDKYYSYMNGRLPIERMIEKAVNEAVKHA